MTSIAPATVSTPIDFDSIKSLTSAESSAVDQLILDELSSDVVLINQIGHYIISNGGKRLRPMLLLLAAKALGQVTASHLILAAVIEFIHTATLLHDDVVDESELRRGRESANAVWGNAASVLVGDYLYSSAFEMMVLKLPKKNIWKLLRVKQPYCSAQQPAWRQSFLTAHLISKMLWPSMDNNWALPSN